MHSAAMNGTDPDDTADDVRAAMAVVHAYLSAQDELIEPAADLVLGLGHFDRAIPRLCAELAAAGRARWIVFSGGVGAGSGDFRQAEALEFRDELRRTHPACEARLACVESASTNTGENLAFTAAALRAQRPELAPGTGLGSVLVVTTPCRLRRAMATVARHWPAVRRAGRCPERSLAEESALYRGQGLDYRTQLVGEVERLLAYPARGFIAPVEVPREVGVAARVCGAQIG